MTLEEVLIQYDDMVKSFAHKWLDLRTPMSMKIITKWEY